MPAGGAGQGARPLPCGGVDGGADDGGGEGFLGGGTAAYHHLAAVIGLSFPCGELGGIVDHGFADDIIRAGHPVRDGEVEPSEAPGIGVEIDEESLSKLATQERRIR